MFGEAHAHLFMNGYDYRKAVETHKGHIEETVLRGYLEEYRKRGVTFIRDGGDDLGVSSFVKTIAPEYGIDYRTPAFAIHKNGCYGSIVGKGFDTVKEYESLVLEAKKRGADFIKLMVSGIFQDMESSHRRRLPGKRCGSSFISPTRKVWLLWFMPTGQRLCETPRNVERTASNTEDMWMRKP